MPAEADGDLGIEIEAACEEGGAECFSERGDWVEAHAEEGVVDAPPEGGEVAPPVGDFSAFESDGWCGVIEDGVSEDEGLGVFGSELHEWFDVCCRVLAIGVHGEGVGEAEWLGEFDAGEDGGSLAFVLGESVDVEVVVGFCGECFEVIVAAVGAAIDDDKDVVPFFKSTGDGVFEEGARVVGRDHDAGFHEEEICCLRYPAGGGRFRGLLGGFPGVECFEGRFEVGVKAV